jgi:alanine dehydrogenase
MLIGVPREVKKDEYRVAMLPVGVAELTRAGHRVLVEAGAGLGSGLSDDQYLAAGAELVKTADEVWDHADLIVKVKEPQASEWPQLRPGQLLFTYLHFAADAELTKNVLASGVTAIAYETLRGPRGDLPLLTPMSEVAGRKAGASCSVAFPAWRRRTSPFWVVALSEKTPPRLRRASRPTSSSSISASIVCGISRTSFRRT